MIIGYTELPLSEWIYTLGELMCDTAQNIEELIT